MGILLTQIPGSRKRVRISEDEPETATGILSEDSAFPSPRMRLRRRPARRFEITRSEIRTSPTHPPQRSSPLGISYTTSSSSMPGDARGGPTANDSTRRPLFSTSNSSIPDHTLPDISRDRSSEQQRSFSSTAPNESFEELERRAASIRRVLLDEYNISLEPSDIHPVPPYRYRPTTTLEDSENPNASQPLASFRNLPSLRHEPDNERIFERPFYPSSRSPSALADPTSSNLERQRTVSEPGDSGLAEALFELDDASQQPATEQTFEASVSEPSPFGNSSSRTQRIMSYRVHQPSRTPDRHSISPGTIEDGSDRNGRRVRRRIDPSSSHSEGSTRRESYQRNREWRVIDVDVEDILNHDNDCDDSSL